MRYKKKWHRFGLFVSKQESAQTNYGRLFVHPPAYQPSYHLPNTAKDQKGFFLFLFRASRVCVVNYKARQKVTSGDLSNVADIPYRYSFHIWMPQTDIDKEERIEKEKEHFTACSTENQLCV